jgi:hypothetical protein
MAASPRHHATFNQPVMKDVGVKPQTGIKKSGIIEKLGTVAEPF